MYPNRNSRRESTLPRAPEGSSSPPPAAPFSRFWFTRSRRRSLFFGLGAGAGVFLGAFLVERHFHHQGASALPMIAGSNALAAAVTALLVVRISYGAIERREALRQRLHAIADINHHIRNGLEVIQLSAHRTEDQRAVLAISNGVERIEWTLREILGPGGPLADTSAWHKEHETKHRPTD